MKVKSKISMVVYLLIFTELCGCSFFGQMLYDIGGVPGGPWVGKSSNELVARIGLPDKTMPGQHGGEWWEYNQCNAANSSVSRDSAGRVNGISADQNCKKWLFGIKDGKVISERR